MREGRDGSTDIQRRGNYKGVRGKGGAREG